MNNELPELIEIAQLARAVFEKNHAKYGFNFSNFPTMACADTSDLLAIWLRTNGFTGVNIVCGENPRVPRKKTHTWLMAGATIIDITSDQFENGLGSVYVGESCAFFEEFSQQAISPTPVSYFDSGVLEQFFKDMKLEIEKTP